MVLSAFTISFALFLVMSIAGGIDADEEPSDYVDVDYGASSAVIVQATTGGTLSASKPITSSVDYSVNSARTVVTITDVGGTSSVYYPTWSTTSTTTLKVVHGGASGSVSQDYVTVTASANSGYKFDGFSPSSGKGYSTITANFIGKYECKLVFNANGGSGAPSTQTYNSTTAQDHTFTISSTTPTRSGYTFGGWGSSSTATTASYQSGGSVTVASDTTVTLYAIWYKQYTLTYDANGGTGGPGSDTKKAYYGGSATFTISSTAPTKSGYTFLGWNTSKSSTSASLTSGDTVSYSANKTIYAIWSKTIKLTYNANGGSGAPSAESHTVYNSTTSYTFTISSTVPTKSGYTFLGWGTSASATSATYSSGQTNVSLTASKTIYAIWSKSVTLTYNANGGSGAPSAETKTIYNSSSGSFTISSTTPTKSTYTFLGWSTSNSATSASYTSGNSISITNNTTLYAVWKLNTYTVTYKNGSSTVHTEAVQHNSTITYTTHSISGKVFCGWYTDSGLTSAFNTSTKITANRTLYGYFVDPLTFTSSPVANATITYASGMGCVLFDALESNSAYKVLWDFGDGSFGDEVVEYHHYEEPGTYNIKLSVFNYNNDVDTREYVVTVYDAAYPPENSDNTLLIVGCTAAVILASIAIIRPF